MWDELVSGCLAEQVAIDRAELGWWLADSGWEQEAVTALADRFFADCELLAVADLIAAPRLILLLAATGYPNSRLMVSSNRSDFAAPNATVFHPDIVPDASAAGLRYAGSLEAAVADLRAAGEIP